MDGLGWKGTGRARIGRDDVQVLDRWNTTKAVSRLAVQLPRNPRLHGQTVQHRE